MREVVEFSFAGASPKPVLLGFGGLGETAVHRDLPKILGLALEVKQQGVHNSTLKRQGKRAGEQRKKDEKFFLSGLSFFWTRYVLLLPNCPEEKRSTV